MKDVKETGGGSRDPSGGLSLEDPFLSQSILMKAQATDSHLSDGDYGHSCSFTMSLFPSGFQSLSLLMYLDPD